MHGGTPPPRSPRLLGGGVFTPLDKNTLRVYIEYMKRFQIRMPEPLMEQFKKIAQEKGLATSDIIRRACDKYLEMLASERIQEK